MAFGNCWKDKDKKLQQMLLPTSLPLLYSLWLLVKGILQKLVTYIIIEFNNKSIGPESLSLFPFDK